MILDEILNRVLPFKTTRGKNWYAAAFAAGGRRIEFQADYEDEGNWVLGFGEVDDSGSQAYGKTGSGKEFEVFATINAIIKEFIRECDPRGIRFTADHADGNRARLYARMLAKNVPPGWKLDVQVDPGRGEADQGRTYFMMARESVEPARATYRKRLRDAAAIAAYIEETSAGYVDAEFVEEHYAGCEAVLQRLPVGDLREGPAEGNVASAAKEAKYARMPAETMPPLVVEGGVVADGNHRFRAAVRRGDTHVWCYVVTETEE